MRTYGTAYAEKSLARVKRPQYVLSIQYGPGDFEYISSHSGIPDIPAGTIEGVLLDYSSVSQSVDPDSGASRIGSLAVQVEDVSEQITDLLQARLAANQGIKDKQVRLYKGFAGLSWNLFELRYTQLVHQLADARNKYTFSCSDLQRSLRVNIFKAQTTTLDATLFSGVDVMTVADTTGFELVEHGSSYSHGPNATWGYLQIDDEIIGYTGKTANTFTGLARGLFNTEPAEHAVDPADPPERRPEVREYIYLELPIPKLILSIQTGQLFGQGPATLPPEWNLGIDPALIDESQYTGIGVDLWDTTNDAAGLIARFTGLESIDGKRFLESQCYRLAQIFSPVLADGRLGLKRLTPALAGAATVATLDNSNVLRAGALTQKMREVVNRAVINWSKISGEFRRQTVKLDTDSIARHGQSPIKVYNFDGLAANSATQSVLDQRWDAIRDRASSPPLGIPVDVHKSMDRLEIGDVVRLNLPSVKDATADTVNPIDRAFEIQQIQEVRKGPLKLQLVGSSAATTPVAPAANALPDAYYDQAGTELSTVVTIAAGVTAAGTFPLAGNASMAGGIYYYIGDLTIANGTILAISDNVQLRVRGNVTFSGAFDGNAGGLAGVADNLVVDGGPGGQQGYFGATSAADGVEADDTENLYVSRPPDTPVTTGLGSLPLFNLVVNGNVLEGVPDDLRGCSGGPGGKLVDGLGALVGTGGGTGGAGGAGLMIVSRGLSIGPSAVIDLGGGDGAIGGAGSINGQGFFPGSGAGGAPGAFLSLLDGNVVVPDILPAMQAVSGDTPIGVLEPLPEFSVPQTTQLTALATGYRDPARVISNQDWSQSAFRTQYIPIPETPVEDLPDTGLTFYYILATNGNAIRNGVGTLTLEARRVTVGFDELLGVGTIQLFDPSNNAITVANGYAVGSNGFTGVFDAGDINGNIVVTLKDGPAGVPLDSVTLVDVLDGAGTPGADGADAVYGFIEPENGLAWTRAINGGAWTPAQATTDLDCTFVQGGVEVARISRRVTLNTIDGTLTLSTTTHPGGDLNLARVAVAITGSATTAITVRFSYSFGGEDSSVAETVGSIQGGDDGLPGSDGADGNSVFVAAVYRRAASPPATPAVDDGSYNFSTNVLTPPAGWSVGIPPGSDPVYVCFGPFEVPGSTGTDNTVTWTAPDLLVSDGADGLPGSDGADGNSVHVATVFISADTAPATPAVNDGSYNFTTNVLTPPAGGWSVDLPDTSNPRWISFGTFEIPGATGIDNTVVWSAPQRFVSDGVAGNVMPDPDFDLSTALGQYWDDGVGKYNAGTVTFQAGLGRNGSNAIQIGNTVNTLGHRVGLSTSRRVRLNGGNFEFRIIADFFQAGAGFVVEAFGYDAQTGGTLRTTVGRRFFGIPTAGTWQEFVVQLRAEPNDLAQWWDFAVSFGDALALSGGGGARFDSIFVVPVSDVFGRTVVDGVVQAGQTPEAPVAQAKRRLLADGTYSKLLADYEIEDDTPVISAGAVTFNLANGNSQYISLNQNVTAITVSGWPAAGTLGELVIEAQQDGTGGRTLPGSAWPAGILWHPNGVPPTMPSAANARMKVYLSSRAAGTPILGEYADQGYS